MDFSNEKYIRIYTRDTTTMKLLGWDGRSVLFHILRRMDRAGVLDLDGIEPWEAAVLHCDAPEDVAKRGMEACLKRGVLVVDGDRLVAPKFLEANETPQSDAQRARESRELRAMLKKQTNVTKRDMESQNDPPSSQTVTPPSRHVTAGHARSQTVTPSVLCCADPSLPSTPRRAERAREGDGGGDPEPMAWAEVALLWEQATGTSHGHGPKVRSACERIAATHPRADIEAAANAAKQEGFARDSGLGPQHFEDCFATYLAKARGTFRAGKQRSGPAPATAFDDFEAQAPGAFDG